MAAVATEEEGVEVVGQIEHMFKCSNEETSKLLKALQIGELGKKTSIIGDVPPSSFDKPIISIKTTPNNNAVERKPAIIQRESSPKSQMDFDVMATRDDDDDDNNSNRSKLNHSHDAYETQLKTQAMRDLDVLLDDDDDESVRVSFAEEVKAPTPSSKAKSKPKERKRRRKPRHSEWLFSCTLDDIDEVVEDLVDLSPFEDITKLFSCRHDHSIIEDQDIRDSQSVSFQSI